MKSTDWKFPSEPTGRLAAYLFLFLIPCVTLIPAERVAVWVTQDLILRWAATTFFILCAWEFLLPRKPGQLIKLDATDLSVLALAAWVLLSVKSSQEAFVSFYAFRSFLAMLLWWFSLRLFWRKWPDLFPAFERVFFWTAVVAGAWLSLTTLAHDLSPYFHDRVIPRIGFFPNENIAAGFLGLALVWGGFQKARGPNIPTWGLALVFLGWCLTQSRGAFLALALVLVFYLLLHMWEVEERLHHWTRVDWIKAGLILLVILVLLCRREGMINRIFYALQTDSEAYKRYDLWASLLRMAAAQPVLGFGPGTFPDVYPAFQPGSLWDKVITLTHDEYLQVVVECGLPALVLLLLFLAHLFRETGWGIRGLKAFQSTQRQLETAECAFFLLALESLHNLVDFTFHEWSHRLVLMAFLTHSLTAKRAPENVKAQVEFSRPAYLGTVFLALLFLGWTMGVGSLRDYLARQYDYLALSLLDRGELNRAEELERQSLRYRNNYMNPWNTLGAIEDLRAEAAKNSKERERHFQLAEEYFVKALELSPYALAPLENQVRDMMSRGRLHQALDLQMELVAKAPGYPTYYFNQGYLQIKVGQPTQAVLSAEKAIEIAPIYLDAHILKAEALEAAGKKAEALRAYRELGELKLSPEILKKVEANIKRLEQAP